MIIRVEKQGDHYGVQNLIREAFWNLHSPGTDKHYIVHLLRKKNYFIPELSLVVEENEQIIGHIIYYLSRIQYEDGTKVEVLIFGPVSIHPDHQFKGIGSKLIRQSLKKAKQMGFKVVVIFGYPEYYQRFGFNFSKHFNIKSQDNKYYFGMQVLELQQGYLPKNVEGVFKSDYMIQVEEQALEAFDQKFPKKQKFNTKSQQIYNIARGLLWNQNCNYSVKERTNNTQKILQK